MCHGGGGGGGGVLGDHTPSHCYKYHGQVLEKCLPGVVLLKAIDKEGFLSFKCLLVSPWSSWPLSLFCRGTTPGRQGGLAMLHQVAFPFGWLELTNTAVGARPPLGKSDSL